MNNVILYHNILDDKLFNKIGYSSQPLNVSYRDGQHEIVELSAEKMEGQEKTYQLTDPKVNWDPDIHDLLIQKRIEIANPQFLFGKNALVAEDGIIGIAFGWYSRDSSLREVFKSGEITCSEDRPYTTEINIQIPSGKLRGKVTFEIFLYLIDNERNRYSIPGTVLGILEDFDVIFDGDSSSFPIVEVNEPSKPLWWVNCDFTDPLYDQFEQNNASIVLNRGHRLARKLKIEKGLGSSPLLLEILASGLQLIVEKAQLSGDWDQIVNGQSEPGSIGQAIYYFINTFGWDISSPERLARSIREDFDTRFK
ncbi:hypothetical protein [Sporolactobacillus sp. THM19-2]|uniref:hypothetical protein n=1 Tax=Sporolactobacillus sp. THM19-2 TaxID=2511171 RepID=UPI0010217464|nr:hypothetical protein [Sporolactobacillus sp. THM19-2]RYL92396.1 hypothetical protein EWH91_07605 [Sporolactobacillus sp. THM19-2]